MITFTIATNFGQSAAASELAWRHFRRTPHQGTCRKAEEMHTRSRHVTAMRRWAGRTALVAAITTLAGLGSVTAASATPAPTVVPWGSLPDRAGQFIRVGTPVYYYSPDGATYFECAFGNTCHPPEHQPGDLAPIWFSKRGEKIAIVCHFGEFSKIKARGGDGWTATRDIHNDSRDEVYACTTFDI
jgi:hypothetical protein